MSGPGFRHRLALVGHQPHGTACSTPASAVREHPPGHMGRAVLLEPNFTPAYRHPSRCETHRPRPAGGTVAPRIRICANVYARTPSTVGGVGSQPNRRAISSSSPPACAAASSTVSASSTISPSRSTGTSLRPPAAGAPGASKSRESSVGLSLGVDGFRHPWSTRRCPNAASPTPGPAGATLARARVVGRAPPIGAAGGEHRGIVVERAALERRRDRGRNS
jgi:hypothetical protein